MTKLLLDEYTGNDFKSGLMNILLIIVTAIGGLMVLYAVYIAFLFATATDDSKRKNAKDRLLKVLSSFLIIFALIAALSVIDLNLTEINPDNVMDPDAALSAYGGGFVYTEELITHLSKEDKTTGYGGHSYTTHTYMLDQVDLDSRMLNLKDDDESQTKLKSKGEITFTEIKILSSLEGKSPWVYGRNKYSTRVVTLANHCVAHFKCDNGFIVPASNNGTTYTDTVALLCDDKGYFLLITIGFKCANDADTKSCLAKLYVTYDKELLGCIQDVTGEYQTILDNVFGSPNA